MSRCTAGHAVTTLMAGFGRSRFSAGAPVTGQCHCLIRIKLVDFLSSNTLLVARPDFSETFVVVALLDPDFFERMEGANVFRDELVRCLFCVDLTIFSLFRDVFISQNHELMKDYVSILCLICNSLFEIYEVLICFRKYSYYDYKGCLQI